jgi:hypothetical protein
VEGLDEAPLFVAATRPALIMGLPLGLFVLFLMALALIMIFVQNGLTTRAVRSCTTLQNTAETGGSADQAAAMNFSLAARSGRKVPLGWGSRPQS